MLRIDPETGMVMSGASSLRSILWVIAFGLGGAALAAFLDGPEPVCVESPQAVESAPLPVELRDPVEPAHTGPLWVGGGAAPASHHRYLP